MLSVVLKAVGYSFRLVLAGFAIGLVAGVLLAVVMTRFRIAARAVLPYLVISQTIPLIALAPLIVSWGGKLEIAGFVWQRWMSASLLGAFLTFFPIAVGTLRGLQSPPAVVARVDGQSRGLVAKHAVQVALSGRAAVHGSVR